MNSLISVLILILVIIRFHADAAFIKGLTSHNYHLEIGIPLAAKIKINEENGANGSQRIVGGFVTDISKVPYQVGVISEIFYMFESVCGGSLISKNRVVTAAHCQWDGMFHATSQIVVLGSNTIFSGGVRIFSTDVVMHPDWNPDTTANDIAIIRISDVDFTDVIQPIALPSESDVNESFENQVGLASGFGMTADDIVILPNQVLHAVNLQIITNAECAKFHGHFVHDTNICISGAEGKSTCFGDSGGPLIVENTGRKILVGAVSYGSRHGCSLGYPVAFSRITSYLSWILSI